MKHMAELVCLLVFCTCLQQIRAEDKKVLLTSLKPIKQTTGWGTIHINQSVKGHPLSLGGKVYANGIGTHAESIFLYQIPHGAKYFSAIVGLDDNRNSSRGEIKVLIQVGKNQYKTIAESPHLLGQHSFYEFKKVKLPGNAKELRIFIDACGSKSTDHTDICNGAFYFSEPTDDVSQAMVKSTPPATVKSTPPATVKKKNTGGRQVSVAKTGQSERFPAKYFHSGVILGAEMKNTPPELVNISPYEPPAEITPDTAYAAVVFRSDKGRSIGLYDYVLIGDNGRQFPCIAMREANHSFDASTWEIGKIHPSTIYALLFRVKRKSAGNQKFKLHFNLPAGTVKDIPLTFDEVRDYTKPSIFKQR